MARLRPFLQVPFFKHLFFFFALPVYVNYLTTPQYILFKQASLTRKVMLYDKKPLCAYFLDLDECTTGSHSCDVNSVCQNTVGSYKCSCNAGYTGDGKPCDGIWDTVDPPCATTPPKRPISRHGATHIVTLKLHTINCFSKRWPTLIWKYLNKTTNPLKVQCLCAKAQHCHVILEKKPKTIFVKT